MQISLVDVALVIRHCTPPIVILLFLNNSLNPIPVSIIDCRLETSISVTIGVEAVSQLKLQFPVHFDGTPLTETVI